MAFLDTLLLREQRALARATALQRRMDFDGALEALEGMGEAADELREAIRNDAAVMWLAEAWAAAELDDGRAMRRHEARAGRYRTPTNDGAFRTFERNIRRRNLHLTATRHRAELVERAHRERLAWLATHPTTVPRAWIGFASRPVLQALGAAWGLEGLAGAHEIEGATRQQLRAVAPLVLERYPEDLRSLGEARLPFARAAAFTMACRPDLAALPLVEIGPAPLVSFELAKVAHALGDPAAALLELHAFAQHVGGHRRIRRLHTGVFAAQMAVAVGDRERALALLSTVPVRFLGGRPVALKARLLIDIGQLAQARRLVEDAVPLYPQSEDLVRMLLEIRKRVSAPDIDPTALPTGELLVPDEPTLLNPPSD